MQHVITEREQTTLIFVFPAYFNQAKVLKLKISKFSNSFNHNFLVDFAGKCLFFVQVVLLLFFNIYLPRKLAQHLVTYFHEIPIDTCFFFENQEAILLSLGATSLSPCFGGNRTAKHTLVLRELFA